MTTSTPRHNSSSAKKATTTTATTTRKAAAAATAAAAADTGSHRQKRPGGNQSGNGNGNGNERTPSENTIAPVENDQKKKKTTTTIATGTATATTTTTTTTMTTTRAKEGLFLRILWWLPLSLLLLYLLPSGQQEIVDDVSFVQHSPVKNFSEVCGKLRHVSQDALNDLFDTGLGNLQGLKGKRAELCIIGVPGLPLNSWFSAQFNKAWRAKIFANSGSEMINDVAGWQLSPGAVSVAPSWFDGDKSVCIDYWKTDYVLKLIHDEVRSVQPNLYIGRTYLVTPFGKRFISNLALHVVDQ